MLDCERRCVEPEALRLSEYAPAPLEERAELVEREVRRVCTDYGKLYFIPGASQGGAMSTFPGVYECTDEMIEKMSAEMF